MRRFLFLIAVLIFSVFIGVKIAEDPGYVVLAYRSWTVEMPLWFMVVCALLTLVIFYWILRFFDQINSSWAHWKNWLRMRRKHKSYSKTYRGLLEMVEEHWKTAENCLMEGVEQSDAPLINFLAAAKAAHEQGAFDKRDIYLRKAYDLAPQAELAIGIVQAQLQLDQGKLEQTLATLNHLRTLSPKDAVVLKLLERVYVHLGAWQDLIKLLPALRKAQLASAQYLDSLESKAYQELLRSAVRFNDVNQLRLVWDSIPKKFQQDPDVIDQYTKRLLVHPDTTAEVEKLIASALNKTWHKELMHRYGLLKTNDAAKQLKTAESWQRQYNTQALLFLTLARLSMACQVWGKAQQYFEESVKLETLPETYLEYGNLLLQLNNQPAALAKYKEGLRSLEA